MVPPQHYGKLLPKFTLALPANRNLCEEFDLKMEAVKFPEALINVYQNT
jgi:hypothetical protein